MNKERRIALVGNPNCGKTSLFNALTGMNQKVGNFPGVTVEKKTGILKLTETESATLIDLPGTYSLSATSLDEKVVQDVLLNPENPYFPDQIVLVLDITNLQRNLFFASQITDLGIPVVMVLNMADVTKKEGRKINTDVLANTFGVPVLEISAKKKKGLGNLKLVLQEEPILPNKFIDPDNYAKEQVDQLSEHSTATSRYMLYKVLNNSSRLEWLKNKPDYESVIKETEYNGDAQELLEINDRYKKVNDLIKKVLQDDKPLKESLISDKIDNYVTHPFWGLLIFLTTFFLLFQAVFSFASYPMDLITDGLDTFGGFVATQLPDGIFNDFVVDGIIAGLSGILVFVPQIMILFGLITLLEDSGYLSRVSFMSDRLLRVFGMNGKSIIPLVGGFACAVPSVMAARGIENKRERLITIFITPLMSCSARLPVYVFLVAFVAPDKTVGGIFNVQGLFMMGLYLLGIIFSLIIALVIQQFLKKQENNSSFILELPSFRTPNWKNVLSSMVNKGKTFVVQAGKVIMIASIILWALAYFGPSEKFDQIEAKYTSEEVVSELGQEEANRQLNAAKLENSYLGHIGKSIEPAIRPLGFDWKIGIALVSSFAAREVFVGTMATIYSVEDDEGGLKSIKFSYATAFSLLIFYVFALQCLSTVAIVKQETGSWKIPLLQLFVFTAIAYLGSLATYQLIA